MDVTEEPVVIRASVGDIYAECYIEVYEEVSETPDRYYSTRITQVLVEGETTLTVGGELLIKVYPVTNGYELEPEEFEIIPTCKEKKIF